MESPTDPKMTAQKLVTIYLDNSAYPRKSLVGTCRIGTEQLRSTWLRSLRMGGELFRSTVLAEPPRAWWLRVGWLSCLSEVDLHPSQPGVPPRPASPDMSGLDTTCPPKPLTHAAVLTPSQPLLGAKASAVIHLAPPFAPSPIPKRSACSQNRKNPETAVHRRRLCIEWAQPLCPTFPGI
jgi:hypothetical protein